MLTPREYAALERVYFSNLERWGFERAHDAALHGFKHSSGRAYVVDDFVTTPQSRARQMQAVRDAADLAAAHAEAKRQIRLMEAGEFDENLLPMWARMSLEEKTARGIQ